MILRADASRIPLASSSVAAVVGSPPYFASMKYDGVPDDHSEADARQMIAGWASEIGRVLVDGGRAWINVPAYFPRPGGTGNDDRWSPAAVWTAALEQAGLTVRDQIIWVQEGAADSDCAWGSYLSPNRPNLRGCYEVIVLASKGTWDRGRSGRNDLPAECWADWTRNVWTFRSQTQKGWHPCPYPEEIPRRAILLSTWPGEIVLDPWMGRNTTGIVAEQLGRRWVTCELSELYCRIAGATGAPQALIPAHTLAVPKQTVRLPRPQRAAVESTPVALF